MTMGRRLTRNRLALDATTPQPEPRLSLLQGIDRGIEERFAAENISAITQLAYADVIDLTIRMGYEFTYIVDWPHINTGPIRPNDWSAGATRRR